MIEVQGPAGVPVNEESTDVCLFGFPAGDRDTVEFSLSSQPVTGLTFMDRGRNSRFERISVPVAADANRKYPELASTPIAAVHQSVAAVLSPALSRRP